jgi:hypothetical protein
MFVLKVLVANLEIMKSFVIIYTITSWRVSFSKICKEWPNNTVKTLFCHEWYIFDNEIRQLVIVIII